MRAYVQQTFGPWDDLQQHGIIKTGTNYDDMRIVVRANADIGILTVEDESTHLQLDQLYLLPECQRTGLGSAILEALKDHARRKRLPLRLRVLACNPAQELYARAGFAVTERTPQRIFMEYRPPAS